jgi:hypothetical protein
MANDEPNHVLDFNDLRPAGAVPTPGAKDDPNQVLDFNDLASPWDRPGAVRRDVRPHRGHILQGLAIASLIVGGIGLCLYPLGLFAGLPLGLTAWLLARRDLADMEAGLMDLSGKDAAQSARRLALAGIVVAPVGVLLLVVMVAIFILGHGHHR